MIDVDELFKETAGAVGQDKLEVLSALINDQLLLEAQIGESEQKLLGLKVSHRELSEKRIPELMLALNLKSLTHESGAEVKIEKYYSGSITEEKAAEAFLWLRDHELEDLIKRQISISFGMGENEAADELSSELESKSLGFSDKATVHPSTLKSLIKERLEAGQDVPFDLFNVVSGMKTKIKRPR